MARARPPFGSGRCRPIGVLILSPVSNSKRKKYSSAFFHLLRMRPDVMMFLEAENLLITGTGTGTDAHSIPFEFDLSGDIPSLLFDLSHAWPVLRLNVPRPLSTTGFPLPRLRVLPSRRANKKRGRNGTATDCSVCLNPVRGAGGARLPCGHRLHHRCLYGLLTLPVLGAGGMMRCPMCRYAVDRYDLRDAIGLDVSPSQLRRVAQRCDAMRALSGGHHRPSSSPPDHGAVAVLVRRLATARASDGFCYNSVLLCLDRALFHRRGMVHGLAGQLAQEFHGTMDVVDFIDNAVACHVKVLMNTAHTVDDDDFE